MFLPSFFMSWTQRYIRLFLCTQKAYFSQILFTNLSKSVLVNTSPLWILIHLKNHQLFRILSHRWYLDLSKWPVYWVNCYFKGYKRLFKCVRWKEQDFVSALAGNRALLLLELSSQCPPCESQSLTVTWIRIRSIVLLNYRDSLNEAVLIAKIWNALQRQSETKQHPSWIHDRHSRRDNDCSGG